MCVSEVHTCRTGILTEARQAVISVICGFQADPSKPVKKRLAVVQRLPQPLRVQRWLIRAVIALAFVAAVSQWFYRWQRERRYDSLILSASRRYGVDPALVKAVIWRESRFKASARGRVGELGLMQIREAAGREWATAEKKAGFNERHLADPDTNLYAGSWYLAHLLKRYRAVDDPLPYALADYNAGRTHVLRWMQGAAKTNSAAFIAKMDFPGTRHYIESVRGKYSSYRQTFRGDTK